MRRKSGRILSTDEYYRRCSEVDPVPSTCKMLWRCDERSGYPFEQVSGCIYDPTNLVVANDFPGSVAYEIENAIRFNIQENGISVVTNMNVTFDTRKVILLTAHISPIETISDGEPLGNCSTRVAMGTFGSPAVGDSAVLSVSFASQQHTQFDTTGSGGAGAQVSVSPETGKSIYSDQVGEYKTIYVMWNGLGSSASVNGTLTSKCLNDDGSVYSPVVLGSPLPLVQETTGLITADTFSPGNMMRPAWAYYYKMEAHELDAVPNNLDLQLAHWGRLARQGYKGGMRFI